jgi:hypothetical protein
LCSGQAAARGGRAASPEGIIPSPERTSLTVAIAGAFPARR